MTGQAARLAFPYELQTNPACAAPGPYPDALNDILSQAEYQRARATIGAWPGYAPTPLVDLAGLAAAAGIGSLHYKDESGRFGLGSFKALGGAYAVARLLQRRIAAETGQEPGIDELLAGKHPAASQITVCCATDGNHGRSVAWGARLFGCACVIFIHKTVSEERKQAIESFGAQVVRTDGNYDDSVRAAQQAAQANGWFVVSDTSYPGYMEVPKDVMQGYTVMAAEAFEQLPQQQPPTHIFLQTGVGGMAAAVASYFWQVCGAQRPRIILADPDRSACWLDSLRAGRPVAVEGDLDTIMAGLACGEVSLLAWEILLPGADAVIAIGDEAAAECMRLLADAPYGDPPVVGGESAVAGLAALLAICSDDQARRQIGLDADSRVLLFGTEGDTAPAIYRQIVGRDAAAVRGA